MILILIYFCVVASLFIFSLPSFSDTTDWMMLDSNDYYENIESSKNEETTYMLTESDSSDKEKDRKINDVNTINWPSISDGEEYEDGTHTPRAGSPSSAYAIQMDDSIDPESNSLKGQNEKGSRFLSTIEEKEDSGSRTPRAFFSQLTVPEGEDSTSAYAIQLSTLQIPEGGSINNGNKSLVNPANNDNSVTTNSQEIANSLQEQEIINNNLEVVNNDNQVVSGNDPEENPRHRGRDRRPKILFKR